MGCFRYVTQRDVEQMVQQMVAELLAPCISPMLNSLVGTLNQRLGALAEAIAVPLVTTVLDAPIDPSFEKRYHGIDSRHLGGDIPVVVEVKYVSTPGSFASHLDPDTKDGRQMSDRWLAARGADPQECVVLGVEVTTTASGQATATIYVREDSEAREWTPMEGLVGIDAQAVLGPHFSGSGTP